MRVARDAGEWPQSRVIIRSVFIALVALTPVYYMFVRYGIEPWPTFSMPRFAGGASVPSHYALKNVAAVTSTGERVEVRWEELFGLPGGVARSVAARNFSPRARPPEISRVERLLSELYAYYPFSNFAKPREGMPHGNDPATREWLRGYLAERHPGVTFTAVEFTWYGYRGFIRDTEIPADATAETYVVRLD